jgi:spore coat polysaccharide biosynthesis protein SpsF
VKPRVMIVQARMNSTRLPGKVLRPIAGKPMLAWQLDQIAAVRRTDRMVVATTTSPEDDPLEALCRERGIACYRGSEHDVLGRYAEAARAFDARTVIRICGDCPLMDPEVVDAVIACYEEGPAADYVSNTLEKTFPLGCGAEVFSAKALYVADAEAKAPAEREHVTPFFYFRPERFRIRQYRQERDESDWRWTVDTPEDCKFVTRILTALAPRPFRKADVLAVVEQHPEWREINAHVRQVVVR